MKFKYDINHECHGCNEIKKTREVPGLDPYHPERINFICKLCDKLYTTIPKILKWNKKNLPQNRANIFHLSKEELKNRKIEITFFNRKMPDFISQTLSVDGLVEPGTKRLDEC